MSELIGKCGFYCGACPTYLVGNCLGCVDEHKEGDFYTRDCVIKSGIRFCGECKKFPCDTILTEPHTTVLDKDWLRWKKNSNTNRYRISNICVFDEAYRRCGIGAKLMRKILQIAKDSGARMAVLETQTCNEKAIAFYKKHGFQIIGFDLYAYTNTVPERKEVRIEMGLML